MVLKPPQQKKFLQSTFDDGFYKTEAFQCTWLLHAARRSRLQIHVVSHQLSNTQLQRQMCLLPGSFHADFGPACNAICMVSLMIMRANNAKSCLWGRHALSLPNWAC